MNKLIYILIAIGAFAVMVGCGSSNSSSGGGGTVVSAPCTQPGCTVPPWAYQPGFAPYQYGYNSAGFCGCSSGFYPAINGANVGCVNTSYIPSTILYASWQTSLAISWGINPGYIAGGGADSYWSGATRANPYAYGQVYGNGACSQNAAQTCNLAQGTVSNPSCGTGQCIGLSNNPTAAASGWGVCTN